MTITEKCKCWEAEDIAEAFCPYLDCFEGWHDLVALIIKLEEEEYPSTTRGAEGMVFVTYSCSICKRAVFTRRAKERETPL